MLSPSWVVLDHDVVGDGGDVGQILPGLLQARGGERILRLPLDVGLFLGVGVGFLALALVVGLVLGGELGRRLHFGSASCP